MVKLIKKTRGWEVTGITHDGAWVAKSDGIENVLPGYEDIAKELQNATYEQARRIIPEFTVSQDLDGDLRIEWDGGHFWFSKVYFSIPNLHPVLRPISHLIYKCKTVTELRKLLDLPTETTVTTKNCGIVTVTDKGVECETCELIFDDNPDEDMDFTTCPYQWTLLEFIENAETTDTDEIVKLIHRFDNGIVPRCSK